MEDIQTHKEGAQKRDRRGNMLGIMIVNAGNAGKPDELKATRHKLANQSYPSN